MDRLIDRLFKIFMVLFAVLGIAMALVLLGALLISVSQYFIGLL